MDIFGPLTTFDIVYAAIAAAAITSLLNLLLNRNRSDARPTEQRRPERTQPRENGRSRQGERKAPLFDGEPGSKPINRGPEPPANMPPSLHGLEGEAFIAQCMDLFPQAEMTFKGTTVHRGDKIRLETAGQRVLIGKFIGKNEQNVICIQTDRNVIAQKLNRVLELDLVTKNAN